MLTSSARWRSDRPPIVLDGEIRQVCRILLAFTRPYLGTASSMSNTLAVSRNSGGSRRSWWIDTLPALRSRLSCARRVRISFAFCRASIRWFRLRSGAADCFVAELAAGGIGAPTIPTHRAQRGAHPQKSVHLDLRSTPVQTG